VNTTLWILVCLAAWCVLAVLTGLVLGPALERLESTYPALDVPARAPHRVPRIAHAAADRAIDPSDAVGRRSCSNTRRTVR
jgi:hypothetical protein